jgi:aryl-alcohol dehydrogenase-like predicted oxidoreductase
MCHRPDPSTPLEETIRAMDDLARAGKILYWGVSAWPAWMMVKAQHLAREIGARPLVVNQPLYNLLYRFEEAEDFPVSQAEGIGNVVFSPLAHGLLTGKYPPGQPPPPDSRVADPRQNAVSLLLYWTDENRQRAQDLAQVATEMGTSASCLAIAWALRHPAVTSAILGARTPAQLDENLRAADLAIPPEVMTRLDQIFPPPGEVLK